MGFNGVGISKAEHLTGDAYRLESWLAKGYQGKMSYMNRNIDKRLDPRLLVPGAKTVISFLYNYHTNERQYDNQAPKISSYAMGKDYHQVIKDKLYLLFKWIKDNVGDINGRVFVDSAPVMERSWAARSGLGWIGKHTNLITKTGGSYFFLAELISDLDLTTDGPKSDHCGTCRKCIDACPTGAILDARKIDGSRCISYFTIELKDQELPAEMKGKFENWIFGCDICQDVCPWNRFATTHNEEAFKADERMLRMSSKDWLEMEEVFFNELFKNSALQRSQYKGIMRNIRFLAS